MSDSESEITPGGHTDPADPANPLPQDHEAEVDLDTSSENITSDSDPEKVQARLADHTGPPPDDEPEIDLETLSEAEKKAVELTKQANSGAAHFKPLGLYEQSLGGTLVFVGFDWDGVRDDECVFIDAKKNATILSA